MRASEARAKVQARVKRISGQIVGIGRMVEEDRYCLDICSEIELKGRRSQHYFKATLR